MQRIVQAQLPNARQEYQRIISQAGYVVNINQAIFVAVLIWWIVWLWLDEPGAVETADAETGFTSDQEPPQAA